MLPSRCIHEPWRNIDVRRLPACRPGSVRHTSRSPIGNCVPGASDAVSSPGIRPRLQTDAASDISAPAPCTKIHMKTFAAMKRAVTTAVRWVWFSSW